MAFGTSNGYHSVNTDKNRAQRPTIPAELILLTLENLKDDYATLFTLSLANKFLHGACQPLLYRSIHGAIGEQVPARKNGNRALLAIMKNFNLGQYVTEFSLKIPIGKRSADVGQYLGPTLHSMVNLKHLSVETFSTENWKLLDFTSLISEDSVERKGTSLAPFRLETFSWTGHIRASSSCSFEQLSSFLNTQHHLRRVEAQLDGLKSYYTVAGTGIRRSRPQKPIGQNACPNLEWVIGNRAAIEALLPGRKVTILEWKPGWDDARGSIAFLSKELSRLKVLSLHDTGWLGTPAPALEMAEYMYNLEYLEVHNMELDFLEWTRDLVSLRGLVIFDDRNRYRPFNMANRRNKIANFFVECPGLQFVAVELPTTFKYNFEWWDRSGLDSEFSGQGNTYRGQWEPKHHVRYSDLERVIYPSIP